MPVELRKRKAPEPAPAPPPKKAAAPKKTAKAATAKATAMEAVSKVKKAVKGKVAPKETKPVNGATTKKAAAAPVSPAAKGDTINFEGFGGEIETHEGEKTTLKALVDTSKAGVVLFTYPAASTPGCTTQACLFRDSYTPLTAGGLAIYGLSGDTPKANSKFKEKQKLPYPLLCDPKATLLEAIGLKKGPGKATRGVFVVDKAGNILAAGPGSPAATLGVVKKVVDEMGSSDAGEAATVDGEKEKEKVNGGEPKEENGEKEAADEGKPDEKDGKKDD